MKLKYLLSVLLFSMLIIFSWSCEKPSDKQSDYFIKFYGEENENDAVSMVASADGGIVFTGTAQTKNRGKDIMLVKVDKSGNHVSWSPKSFGTETDDNAYCIKALSDGYIIAGSSQGFDDNDDLDAYIIRTDLQGNIKWEKTYENIISSRQMDNEAFSIELTNEGGFIFVGYTGDSNNSRLSSIIILDADGNVLKQSVRGDSKVQLSVILKLKDGNYIVLGSKQNADLDFFVLTINKDGNDLNNDNLGEKGRNDMLNCGSLGQNNTIFLAGTSSGFGSADDSFIGNTKEILVYKYEIKSGNILWKRRFGGNGDFEGRAVKELANGNLLLLGDRTVAGNKNIVLYFLDRDGNTISTKEFGGSGNQSASDMLYDNGQILILGKNTYEGSSVITLIKTDSEGNLWE